MGMKIKINKSALDKVVKDAAVAKATEMTYDIACPHCHAAINVPVGKSVCPACGSEIDLKLKFDCLDKFMCFGKLFIQPVEMHINRDFAGFFAERFIHPVHLLAVQTMGRVMW